MIRKKRNSVLLLLLLVCLQSFSQQFRYTASLPAVNVDSFYSIPITPEMSSYLATNLRDIRIADEKGAWVPHIVNTLLEKAENGNIIHPLPVLSKENSKTATFIIVNNSERLALSNFRIESKNSNSTRLAVISGSEDNKNWFTITDSILLASPEIAADNKSYFIVRFPSVNYAFIRISIYNANKDPFYISSVLTELPGHSLTSEVYVQNPSPQFSQKDTLGFSLLRIENKAFYHFNRFTIHVQSPKFYNRRVRLYDHSNVTSIQSLIGEKPFREFVFSSGDQGKYETPLLHDKIFYLLIENKDNPPLQINSIVTEQISRSLIAWLEKGHQYKILLNNPLMPAPDYDLQQFREIIPGKTLVLHAGSIVAINPEAADSKKNKDTRKWLWPAIIIILSLLIYFTWTLTKDLKKEKAENKK